MIGAVFYVYFIFLRKKKKQKKSIEKALSPCPHPHTFPAPNGEGITFMKLFYMSTGKKGRKDLCFPSTQCVSCLLG